MVRGMVVVRRGHDRSVVPSSPRLRIKPGGVEMVLPGLVDLVSRILLLSHTALPQSDRPSPD